MTLHHRLAGSLLVVLGGCSVAHDPGEPGLTEGSSSESGLGESSSSDDGGIDDDDGGVFVCEPRQDDVVARFSMVVDGVRDDDPGFEDAAQQIGWDPCEVVEAEGPTVRLRCPDIDPDRPPHEVEIAIDSDPALDLGALPSPVDMWHLFVPGREHELRLYDSAGETWLEAHVGGGVGPVEDLDCEPVVGDDGCARERVALTLGVGEKRLRVFDGHSVDQDGWRIVVERAELRGDLLGNACEAERDGDLAWVFGPAA